MLGLELSADEQAFRADLRAWLAANLPAVWPGERPEVSADQTARLALLSSGSSEILRTLLAERALGLPRR